MRKVTIVVMNHKGHSIDIIHHAERQADTNDYLNMLCIGFGYNENAIDFEIFDDDETVIPNHYNPEDFESRQSN